MKVYEGRRLPMPDGMVHTGCEVFVTVRDGGDIKPLPWRLDLFNHSPTGLNWGYAGSGPAQLALAILADCLGNNELAVRLHQAFKRRVVARFDDKWSIDERAVYAEVERLVEEQRQ